MSNSWSTLLNYGKYHRIWPYADLKRNELYVSVALVRPFTKPICKLLVSQDYCESWSEIADFHSLDKRNTTTGQPFVTRSGIVLVPVWSAGFYTHGETWFCIYKSEDNGSSWKRVYEDLGGTYGKHFFENPADGNLFIGVGVGGGGRGGKISSTPSRSYLLKSMDSGETWVKVLEIDYPTAIYSGVVVENQTIVTAREKKSVFQSADGGDSWTESALGNTVRNVSYITELNEFIVTSNGCFFSSRTGIDWFKIKSPIRLVFRYPIFRNGKLYMAGVGWRSLVISTDFKKWYVDFDATKFTGSNLFARMAIMDDYIFIGDEMNGMLLRVRLQKNKEPVTAFQLLEFNARYLPFMAQALRQKIFGRRH